MPARGDTKLNGFYFPWPNMGIKLSRQWQAMRENTEKMAPLVRAAYVDPQPVTAHDPGNHDLAGWAIGERDFRNRFRIWYDQVNDRFSIQYNSGTEAAEVWDDYLTIRQVDGRVTIPGYGGLQSIGGFYTAVPRNLAKSATFPLSNEWIFEHDLDTVPVLWETFDNRFISIVPYKVDVSNPNIAYFYFLTPKSGTAMTVAEQARGEGISVTDGTNFFGGATRLGFNPADFYLTNEGHGDPVVNLQPIDASSIDTSSFILSDGSNPFSGDQSMGGNQLTNVGTPGAGTDAANKNYVDTAVSGVGVDVTDSFGTVLFNDVSRITFESQSFYLKADSLGRPTVNFRGTAGGSGGVFGSGVKTQNFTSVAEWVFTHNLGVDGIVWDVYDDQGEAVIPDKVSTHNVNTAYFYFGAPLTGKAVVIGGPTVGVNVTDTHVQFTAATTLKFNPNAFYLTGDSAGNPMVNFSGTAGSGGGINNVVEDLTPQLGGDLDVNGKSIIGVGPAPTGNINIQSGDAGPADAEAGTITITGGAGPTTADGGSILITAGSSGSGNDGVIQITTNNSVLSLTGGGGINLNAGANSISAGNSKIINLLDPASAQDAATKAYVDSQTGGSLGNIITAEAFYIRSAGELSNAGDGLEIKSFNSAGVNNAGSINITAGSAAGVASGGSVRISAGAAPLGSSGDVTIDGAGGVVELVATSGISILSPMDMQTNFIRNVANPVLAQDAATKAYADSISGSFYGIYIRESDGNPPTDRDDTLIFDSAYFYLNSTSARKPMVSLRSSGGVTAHSALTGLSADDHTQYSLVDGTRAFTGVVSGITPTTAANLATKGYVDTAVGPGFYGIFIRESDGNPPTDRDDTLIFDSAFFYLNSTSVGKPMVSLRAPFSLTVKDIDNTPTVSNVNTIQFTNGTVVDQGGGVAEVTISTGAGISAVDDGTRSYSSLTSIGFNDKQFYISKSTTANKAVLNLRDEPQVYKGHLPGVIVDNLFIEPDAEHAFTVVSASLDLRNGTASCGFYIVRASNLDLPGRPITGMDRLVPGTTKITATATALNTMNVGDRLVLSVFGVTNAEHLVYTVRLRKT